MHDIRESADKLSFIWRITTQRKHYKRVSTFWANVFALFLAHCCMQGFLWFNNSFPWLFLQTTPLTEQRSQCESTQTCKQAIFNTEKELDVTMTTLVVWCDVLLKGLSAHYIIQHLHIKWVPNQHAIFKVRTGLVISLERYLFVFLVCDVYEKGDATATCAPIKMLQYV